MTIKDFFEKEIDRDFQGVIKVGQDSEKEVYQELDEYVVTRELKKHFAEFFDNYARGIQNPTDKMGVWISGFFGSGKSHFLKILSYILNPNKVVDGKKPVDFFTDGKKINDPTVIANMKLASSVTTDVVLFNIDSKSESMAKNSNDAIISVFLKVFNEMQGFCGSIPFIAEFERNLSDMDKYDLFKDAFQKRTGKPWEQMRQRRNFIYKDVKAVLVETGIMDQQSAEDFISNAEKEYSLSIENFAKMVNDYCEKKGPNHHIVFLVDEIGQYIGSDTRLMLSLQTVTEDLGTACRGKAWIIVTSQEDIDSIVKVQGNDFSKIQGRFNTRLSLSSANVDEVIRERILKKKPEVTTQLKQLYSYKESVIKNLITFSDQASKPLYENDENFAQVYPFIPYQFFLLGNVLTSIRIYGAASGKAISEGERNLIALFKEAAMKYENSLDSENILIPFYTFYDGLEKYVDHTHSIVITHAKDNKMLEPFDVELLKVLFMIKYVKEIKGTIENLTTLMIDCIDTDRIELTKKVEDSLQRLINQTLIQKNGDVFTFLTNDEQDINRQIKAELVEPGEIIAETSKIIFNDIYKDSKYRYSNRYNFAYNQKVDDAYKVQNEPIGLQFITPYNTYYSKPDIFRQNSMAHGDAIFVFPNNDTFINEIKEELQISKFLTKNSTELAAQYDSIKRAKQDELAEKKRRIVTLLENAIESADVFINGDSFDSSTTGAVSKIDAALKHQVDIFYNKLYYMKTSPDSSSISNALNKDATLGLGDTTLNDQLALDEVKAYIENCKNMATRVTLKTLLSYFTACPYGFIEFDIEYLVAELFKQSKISFELNGRFLTLSDCTTQELVNYLTRRDYQDKLIIAMKEHVDAKQMKDAKDVLKDLFNTPSVAGQDDEIAKIIKNAAQNKVNEINTTLAEYNYQSKFPGKQVLEDGKVLVERITAIANYLQVFKYISDNYNELLDFADDSKDVFNFFKSEQKTIFSRSIQLIDLYNNSANYITDPTLGTMIQTMNTYIAQPKPWNVISVLNTTNQTFEKQYNDILEKEKQNQKPVIDFASKQVMAVIEQNNLSDTFGVKQSFADLETKLKGLVDIPSVKAISAESDAVKQRLLAQISSSLVTPASGGDITVAPVSKPVQLKHIVSNTTVQLKSDNDVDALVAQIAQNLKDQIKSNNGGITLIF